MGVFNFIKEKKEQFKDVQASVQRRKLESEIKSLEREKVRQGALFEASSRKALLQKDVSSIKNFNEKQKSPSALATFGSNLAKFQNRNQSTTAIKKQSRKQSLNKLKQINQGSKLDMSYSGLDFGGSKKIL